jgi:hypothetical protein
MRSWIRLQKKWLNLIEGKSVDLAALTQEIRFAGSPSSSRELKDALVFERRERSRSLPPFKLQSRKFVLGLKNGSATNPIGATLSDNKRVCQGA